MLNSLRKDIDKKQIKEIKNDTNTYNIKNIKENFNNLKKLKKVNLLADFPNINSSFKQNEKNNNDNNSNEEIKSKKSVSRNNLNNSSNTNNKNNLSKSSLSKINFFSPKTISKFKKINPLSPLNYFKKYSFLFKNKSLPNFNLKKENKFNNILKKENNTFNNSMDKSKYKASLGNYNYSRNKFKKQNNFSKYYYKSQNDLYTSRRIYKHYIQESQKDKIVKEKYFRISGAPKRKNELDNLYKLNFNFHRRIDEIKNNKSIAYKNDFNILSYQATLMKLLSKHVSEKNFNEMQNRYININQKLFGLGFAPRGRFTNLAEKIKFNVPSFLYEKIKKLDQEKLLSRYNYFKRAQEKFLNRFERRHNNTPKEIYTRFNDNHEFNLNDNEYKNNKSKRKINTRSKKIDFYLNNNYNYNLSF